MFWWRDTKPIARSNCKFMFVGGIVFMILGILCVCSVVTGELFAYSIFGLSRYEARLGDGGRVLFGIFAFAAFIGGSIQEAFAKGVLEYLDFNGKDFVYKSEYKEWIAKIRRDRHGITESQNFQAPSHEDQSTFVYLECCQCGAKIRIPAGKGQIMATCPKCGNRFIMKS